MMRDEQTVLRCLQSSEPPPASAACGGIFPSLDFWVARSLLFIKQEGLLMEVTNSQACVFLVWSHQIWVVSVKPVGKQSLGWTKCPARSNSFTSSGHFLQTFSYGRATKDLNLCSLATTNFLLCTNLVPDPFLKSINGKVLSKIATSLCILVILRKKNSPKYLTKKSSLAFGALLFGYREHNSYQASVILVLWVLIPPFYLH